MEQVTEQANCLREQAIEARQAEALIALACEVRSAADRIAGAAEPLVGNARSASNCRLRAVQLRSSCCEAEARIEMKTAEIYDIRVGMAIAAVRQAADDVALKSAELLAMYEALHVLSVSPE